MIKIHLVAPIHAIKDIINKHFVENGIKLKVVRFDDTYGSALYFYTNEYDGSIDYIMLFESVDIKSTGSLFHLISNVPPYLRPKIILIMSDENSENKNVYESLREMGIINIFYAGQKFKKNDLIKWLDPAINPENYRIPELPPTDEKAPTEEPQEVEITKEIPVGEPQEITTHNETIEQVFQEEPPTISTEKEPDPPLEETATEKMEEKPPIEPSNEKIILESPSDILTPAESFNKEDTIFEKLETSTPIEPTTEAPITPSLEEHYELKEKLLSEINDLKVKLKKHYELLKESHNEVEQKSNEIVILEDKKVVLSKEIHILNDDLLGIKAKIEESTSNYDSLVKQNEEVLKTLSEYALKAEECKQEISSLESKANDFNQEISDLVSKLDILKKDLLTASKEVEDKRIELNALELEIESKKNNIISEAKAAADEILKEIDEKTAEEKEKYNNFKNEIDEEMKGLKKRNTDMEEKLMDVEKIIELKKNDAIEEAKRRAREEINKTNAEIEKIKMLLNDYADKYNEQEETYCKMKESYESEINILHQEKDELEKEVNELIATKAAVQKVESIQPNNDYKEHMRKNIKKEVIIEPLNVKRSSSDGIDKLVNLVINILKFGWIPAIIIILVYIFFIN